MEVENNASCDGFPTDSSTSSDVHVCEKERKPKEPIADTPECTPLMSTSTSSSSSMSTAFFNSECRLHKSSRKDPPNIGYELAVAKSIMQQYSTLSGDNLFDHLADIIKRVIDERPPNVIDFFEEFSRNVREQKFHLPERFPPGAIYEESRIYRVAKKQLLSMKLPKTEDDQELNAGGEDIDVEDIKPSNISNIKIEIDEMSRMFITFNERVQQLQFFWNQCGFSISSDDIFQLACAMDRLQTHPSIMQCRFWGIINGLKSSYYIVEASLTREEIDARIGQMTQELRAKQKIITLPSKDEKPTPPSHIGPELTPGCYGWENYPQEELNKMRPEVVSVPLVDMVEVFDVPPETIGLGLNRYSYFVVNSLSDDWIELPIVTPRQIQISREIKKFLTGDLEAEIHSYPCFPGKEKHYLRTLIARITAGTYIAPSNYYRKMTKQEKRLYEGIEDDEMDEEEEEDNDMNEGDEEEIDNDIILLKNEEYAPQPLQTINHPANWIHVRPNILIQGRVVWFDEEKARKDREKEMARRLKMLLAEETGEEDFSEEEAEEEEETGEEEGILESLSQKEVGPPIMHPCDFDVSEEFTVPWIPRYTSSFTNKNERVLVMHSNVWPGAYTFTFEKLCESIYMGWGHKYTSRNMAFKHLPPVVSEYPHGATDFIESTDPSVADEELRRLALLRRQMTATIDDGAEHLGEYDDADDDDDDTATDVD